MPSKIQQTKKTFCVWFSIVWHTFLEELGIKHKWRTIFKHSALEVNIWLKKYYFDATWNEQVFEFEDWKQIWDYKEMIILFDNTIIKSFSWNVEKILLSQLYNDIWDILVEKWDSLYYLWKHEKAIVMYEKAIKMYNKSLELEHRSSGVYYNKWNAYKQLKKYEKAIEMYDKAIESNPEDFYACYNKWNVSHKLWRYEEAIEMYDKAIEIDPRLFNAYYNKWVALYNLGRDKEGTLYQFSADLLRWEDTLFDFYYIEEKKIIRDYIKNKDFEWLRVYLLGLENE
jgi:tetratricopeptide (TPR) repeat protein